MANQVSTEKKKKKKDLDKKINLFTEVQVNGINFKAQFFAVHLL